MLRELCVPLLVLCVAACGQEFVSAAPAGNTSVPVNDLLLWLRADQGVTETGGGVSRWADQSDRHADAVQDQPGLRPTRRASGVHFDGVDDYLAMPVGFSDFSRGVSIVAVINQQQADTCTATVELSNGSEIDDISFGQYQNRILYEVFDQDTSGDTLSYGVPQMLSVVHRTDQTVVHPPQRRHCGQRILPAACGDRARPELRRPDALQRLRHVWRRDRRAHGLRPRARRRGADGGRAGSAATLGVLRKLVRLVVPARAPDRVVGQVVPAVRIPRHEDLALRRVRDAAQRLRGRNRNRIGDRLPRGATVP